MGIKTTLPSTKRLFVLFTIIGVLVSAGVFSQITPQASQVSTTGCTLDIAYSIDTASFVNTPSIFKEGLPGVGATVAKSLDTIDTVNKSISDSNLNVRVGLTTFPADNNRVSLTNDTAQLREALKTLAVSTGPDVATGITRAHDQLAQGRTGLAKSQRLIIVISPAKIGFGARGNNPTPQAAAKAAKKDSTLIGVQLGENHGVFDDLATPGHVYQASTKNELENVLGRITNKACPSAVPTVTTGCTNNAIDLTYLVDNSGTMDDGPAAKLLKDFVTKGQSKLRSGSDQAALITFSDPSSVKQDLTKDLSKVTTAANALSFNAGGSNVSQGIQEASKQLLAKRRSKTEGIVVILTDTQSRVSDQGASIINFDMHNNNIRYIAVALGGENTRLQNLESEGASYVSVANAEALDNAVTTAFNKIDGPYANCISLELQANKSRIRKGGKATLTYKYSNNSRRNINFATVKQTLPTGLVTLNGDKEISHTIGAVSVGDSGTYKVDVKTN